MSTSLHPYDGRFTDVQRKNMFARTLKLVREERGLSKADVYKAIGVKPQTYDAYENGNSNPTIETLVRLSYALNYPIDALVQRENIYGDTDAQIEILGKYTTDINEILGNEKVQSNEQIMAIIKQMSEFVKSMQDVLNKNDE